MKKVESLYKRGIYFLPTKVLTRDELEKEMIKAVEANPMLSDRQKLHAIEMIVTYSLADVAWAEPEYQNARKKLLLDSFVEEKYPKETWSENKKMVERMYSTNRLDTMLFLLERPMSVSSAIYVLSEKFRMPYEDVWKEIRLMLDIGLLEIVEEKIRVSKLGMLWRGEYVD